jgi:hypothetical protein
MLGAAATAVVVDASAVAAAVAAVELDAAGVVGGAV